MLRCCHHASDRAGSPAALRSARSLVSPAQPAFELRLVLSPTPSAPSAHTAHCRAPVSQLSRIGGVGSNSRMRETKITSKDKRVIAAARDAMRPLLRRSAACLRD